MRKIDTEILNFIERIEPKSSEWADQARARIEKLTMPHWAMGRVLDLAVDLSAMTRSLSPAVTRKAVFIMAGDHGVTEEGVSLYPKEVTAQMIYNFASGGAAINVLSRMAGARTFVVDLGVDADLSFLMNGAELDQRQSGMPSGALSSVLVHAKIRRGTHNFARWSPQASDPAHPVPHIQEPLKKMTCAMSREEAEQSILIGARLAESYAPEVDLFATGDMGIGNTTPSAAIASVLTGIPVKDIVGRGTGIPDPTLSHKTRIIEKALAAHQPDPSDAIDVLSKVGGFEIGAIAGLILGAASLRRPILLDGYISTAGALLAHTLCPLALDYVIPAHSSAEAGHAWMCQHLQKRPLLDLGLRLGEGTGAVLAMNLVEAAARILTEMATFDSARVSAAEITTGITSGSQG